MVFLPTKRSMRLGIIWTMIFALMIPLLLPQHAGAQGNDASTSYLNETDKSAAVEVSSEVMNEFEKEEYVSFLVKMKDQVDTEKVAADVASNNIQVANTSDVTLAQRTAIVSELRSTAMESQVELKDFLAKEEKNGNVKNIRSFYIVNGLEVVATKEVLESLKGFSEIAEITPNEEVFLLEAGGPDLQADNAPTDTPKTANEDIEWNIEQIGAPDVWDMGVDGQGIVVGNIDTGVQWDHPSFKHTYRGYDAATDTVDHTFSFFDATSNGNEEAYDDHGHGTHVNGTIVGGEEDGSNKVGVAPGAQWIAAKALSASGGGTQGDLLAAGEWMLAPTDADGNPHPEHAPDVVNNSWGGSGGLNEWYRPMVQNWRAAGILPVFASGNTAGPGTVGVPANYPESYAVGATDSNQNLASFSSQGPSPYDEMKPDVSAPGVNVRSAVPGSGYEGGWNGTSMAAPHVAGLAALLLQVNSDLSLDDLAEIMETTATPRTNDQYPEAPNNGFGHGIINAYDAVMSVMDGIGNISGNVLQDGEDTEPPTYEHTAPEETYEGLNLPLEIHVQDNVSITDVTLSFEKDGEWHDLEANRRSGDFRDAIYEVSIPGSDIDAPAVEYFFTIDDFGGNTVETDVYEVAVNEAISTGYYQDFESTPIGWMSFGDNDSWEWGEPTSGPNDAYTGDNVYATNLDGDYGNDMNATLIMPPVQVPDEGDFYLEYKEWFNFETNYDYGYLVVSTDGMDTWETLHTVNGESGDWVDASIDLSEYAGERIVVGFNAYSDFIIVRPGWYIDHVSLTDEATGTDDIGGSIGIVDNNIGFNQMMAPMMNVGTINAPGLLKKKTDPSQHVTPPGKDADFTPPGHKDGHPGKGKDDDGKSEDDPEVSSGLPLSATVSVLESGRSVQTNPSDGSFNMMHPAGDFTVRAEAYGFHAAEEAVSLEADENAEVSFVLDELDQGTVTGTVSNEATDEPIEGATVLLKEDPRVAPATTDADGSFSIDAYEGTYTLQVFAPSFYSSEAEVTIVGDEVYTEDISLTPFIGFPGEIGYDDGTAENARAFFDAGNGWAVRMSLEDGQDSAMITGGLFRFWDTEWPVPGGTDFQVAIYDATGTDGAPGERIAGPFDAEAMRDGTWTHVDLESEGIIVDGDFYLMYIQTDPNPYSPGLATDEDGPYSDRNWQYVGGSFTKSPESEGNYMIRALVNYEVSVPTIESPEDGTFTNEDTVTVEGQASPSVNVHLSNNGEEVAETTADDSGNFSVDVSLEDGENVLTAAASTDTGRTGESESVTVILDQEAPELVIESPADGDLINREAITVTGTASDDNLDSVQVNGQDANVDEDGNFSHRMLVDEGANEINVVALDLAGNTSEETITVHANFGDYELTNITPEEDTDLNAGETVLISFEAEEGLDATFVIRMPLTNLPSAQSSNATELPMQETSPGYYVGYYTATSNVEADGAEVEVIARDDYGNEVRALADGKLFINVE
ncbi:S8 family serine peptidase [Evansella halocellulosilytica]|uniref:S8 family serine peptidase n=1 Tax=Evansella halocellulosilytica TaxID=2011013 RepID=UPI0027B9E26A|nr:S8 family serine peptidase [Evansella halocellulosilytica]